MHCRAGYNLPPEFPSDGEYYDGHQLPMRAMQPMSSSFVQISNPPGAAAEPPSPTAMTLNSQYENMSTGSSKGAVYEPLEPQKVATVRAVSTEGNRGDVMRRSAQNPQPGVSKKSAQTPIRQKYKGFAQSLRMRHNKQKRDEALRKSVPIQPPRISSLIKQNAAQPASQPASQPDTPKHTSKRDSRSRRSSKSAPSRRVPTPPPSPPPELKMAASSATSSSSPTYSVPMRNSMMPDVVYQTTEACFGSDEQDTYEVPVSQRGAASSTSGTTRSSSSVGGSAYAPVRMKDALSGGARSVAAEDADELDSVYSCTQAVDAATNSPINSSCKPVISMTRKPTDPDAKTFIELDLSKPMVVSTILQLDIDNGASKKDEPTAAEEVYANIGPRSKRTSALVNTSDYGALCEHSSNAKQQDIGESEDVYATAQQYYVSNTAAI